MFRIYVVMAGQKLVTEIAGLTRAGAFSKPHHYKQKVKSGGHPENMDFNGKTF